MSRLPLPIDQVIPRLLASLGEHACVVLKAPTGSGKTTRVATAIAESGIVGDSEVMLIEPRRMAARAAATWMASELEEPVGKTVGYAVRFERRASRDTRVLVATQGIALRRLLDDPWLEGVGCLVFDEFHERSLDGDLALAMARRVQSTARPDLKIVVMSATLDVGPIAKFLGDCPAVESEGRLHPVAVTHLDARGGDLTQRVVDGVRRALEGSEGDVLVFLPGMREIRRAGGALEETARTFNLSVTELHGEQSLDRQMAALRRVERRKVVLSTNLAETSVTVEGVTAVVDSGLARVLRFDPAIGLNRLEVERISKAAAEQRAGRAGRLQPGICLRLWSQAEHHHLAPFELPEVRRVEVAGALLSLFDWGESDPLAFPWFEPPPLPSTERALQLLHELGALDERITPLGRRMAKLPVHPRLARLLMEGARLGCARQAALAAALLSERSPFEAKSALGRGAKPTAHRSDSDLMDRVTAVEDYERTGRRDTPFGRLARPAVDQALRVRDQFLRLLQADVSNKSGSANSDEGVRRALLTGLPDRLARRREAGSRRARMVGGRGVALHEQSGVVDSELFICLDIDERGESEAIVRLASAVDREWLDPRRIRVAVAQRFDAARERVVAVRRVMYDDLVLEESPAALEANEETSRLLVLAASAEPRRSLDISEEAQRFLDRANWLRSQMPDRELPELGDEALRAVLPSLAAGCTSLAEVRKRPLLPFLKGMLSAEQLTAIEREAPERIAVPSGSRIALEYAAGKAPVLAVRIQELFGLRQTPTVAGGQVRVLLQLLGPNYRPQQMTDDLPSFWQNTYPVVRKELRRRYPKHSWPDDPLAATPERKPGGKRQS